MNYDMMDIRDLVKDLTWDYDRMSESGKETMDKLCELLQIN